MPGQPGEAAPEAAPEAPTGSTPRASTPAAPPATAMTRLSVSICWTRRPLAAPTAVRIETSFCRAAARASSSVATFAQAISSTNATAPSITSSMVRTSPTSASRSGRRLGRVIRVLGGKLLRRAASPMIRRSSRRDPPATRRHRSRPITSRKCAARSVRSWSSSASGTTTSGCERPPELRRQHADDLEGLAVERDRPADHRRIGAEAPAPQRVAEQDDAMAADGFLLGAEVASERRRDADDVEKRRRHLRAAARARVRRHRSGCRRPTATEPRTPPSPRTNGCRAASRR